MHSFWGIFYNISRVQLLSAIMDVGSHLILFGIVILQSTFELFGFPNFNHCLARLLNGTRCFLSLSQHRALKPLIVTAFLWFSTSLGQSSFAVFGCIATTSGSSNFQPISTMPKLRSWRWSISILSGFLVTCLTGMSANLVSRCGNSTHF